MAEWIGGIKMIDALAVYPGATGDARDDPAVRKFIEGTEEHGVENAGLTLGFTGFEFSGGLEAGELRAGAGAAWRAVVGFSRAKHEVATVGKDRIAGWSEHFDVIDFHAAVAGDALSSEFMADGTGEFGQVLKIPESHLGALPIDKEKPVSAPCDVAVDGAPAGDFHRHRGGFAVARDIRDFHRTVGPEFRRDDTDGRVDAMHA